MPDRALDLFRDACGLSAPLTLEVRDTNGASGRDLALPFDLPFALVGRDPRADVVLEDPQVSRRHAYFQAVGGRVLCIDLHSRTRLRWEGEEGRRDRGWLAPGHDVWIGPFALHWTGAGSSASLESISPAFSVSPTPPGFASSESGSLPRAALALPAQSDAQGPIWQLDTIIGVVGRSEQCHLVLGHESVSRLHASLIRTPRGVFIVDLLAREGVRVNGQSVRWAWLEDGDTVRIGRFTFILRYETSPSGILRRDVPLDAGANVDASRSAGRGNSGGRPPRNGTILALRSRKPGSDLLKAAASPPRFAPPMTATEMSPTWELAGAMPPQQLAIWQQQMKMMETFHDDMMLMVQMFMAMHREHLGAVKEELDKVRELSSELGRLRDKLDKPAQSPQEARSPNREEATPSTQQPGGDMPASRPRPFAVAADSSTAQFATDRFDQPGAPAPRPTSTVPAASGGPASKPRPETYQSLGEQTKFHLDITRRITELQRQRQGYWQRIMNSINGQSS